MDPQGNIRPLADGEQPRSDEVLLDGREARRLGGVPKAKRHAALAKMRTPKDAPGRRMSTRQKREQQRQRARDR